MTKENSLVTSSNGFLLNPNTMDEALKLCNYLAKSNFIPAAFIGKPGDIFVVSAYGARLGMDPFASMQNIASVNGRPCIYGDGALAIVQRSGLCEKFIETLEGTGGQMVAVCVTKRKGNVSEQTYRFSVADAQTAGLWGRKGPWVQYPQRMLQMRARAFCLRSAYADVLSGLGVVEEMRDTVPGAGAGAGAGVGETPATAKAPPALSSSPFRVDETKKPVYTTRGQTREEYIGGVVSRLKERNALEKAMPYFRSQGQNLTADDLLYAESQVKLAKAEEVVLPEELPAKAEAVDVATGEVAASSLAGKGEALDLEG